MNKIINTLFLVLGTIYSFAQTSTDYKWSIGFSLLPNHLNRFCTSTISNNYLINETKNKMYQPNGFGFGLVACKKINEKLSINFGAIYTSNTLIYNCNTLNSYSFGTDTITEIVPSKISTEKFQYLKIPISVQFNLPIIKNRNVYYFIEPGINLSFLLNYNSNSVGVRLTTDSTNWHISPNKWDYYLDYQYARHENIGWAYNRFILGAMINNGITIVDNKNSIKLGVFADYDFSNSDYKSKYYYIDNLYTNSLMNKKGQRVPTHNYITGLNLSWLYNF